MDVLTRLTIEAECQRLICSFAQGQDDGNGEAMAALFTADGFLDRPGKPVQGRAQISAHFSGHVDHLLMRNVVSTAVVTVIDENHATSRAYYVAYRHIGDAADGDALPRPLTGPVFVGEYLSEFVRTPEGWRYARQKVVRLFENSALAAATGIAPARR